MLVMALRGAILVTALQGAMLVTDCKGPCWRRLRGETFMQGVTIARHGGLVADLDRDTCRCGRLYGAWP